MRVSLITVCYNSAQTIKDTFASVFGQTHSDIEYIVVDGNSTDGTREIIEANEGQISKIISEPDKGIYDAMNKGVKAATGDIVGIINSDDFLANEDVIKDVVAIFKREKVDSCYGNIDYVDRTNTSKTVRKWVAGDSSRKKFEHGWIPPHPAFFVKNAIYKKHGGYNLDLAMAADYELLLRFLHKHKISTYFLNKVLVKMREGGTSAKNIKARFKGWKDIYRAWHVNDMKPSLLLVPIRVLLKIKQFI